MWIYNSNFGKWSSSSDNGSLHFVIDGLDGSPGISKPLSFEAIVLAGIGLGDAGAPTADGVGLPKGIGSYVSCTCFCIFGEACPKKDALLRSTSFFNDSNS